MPYNAQVFKVMIASPSDVSKERQIATEVIHNWNYVNSEERQMVLMPTTWETHSSPMLGGRPQAIINKQVLEDCDLLVAIFWTRIGTHTGQAQSGTVEEIERHLGESKPTMLYFSSEPVKYESVDPDQYAALSKFKQDYLSRGLVCEYENISDLEKNSTGSLC